VGNLERRIRRLEAATGGGSDGCERCAGTMTMIISGETDSVTRHGHKLPNAAAVAFIAEEGPNRICPVCGKRRTTSVIKVGGPERLPPSAQKN
jgi:hypothetical protein